jgi:hypothetical protein
MERYALIQNQYRLFFGEATVNQSVSQQSSTSQMEIVGSQSQQSGVVNNLVEALQQLCTYFKSKFDCWLQPPLCLAQLHRGNTTAATIIESMGSNPTPTWNWRGFLNSDIQKELLSYSKSTKTIDAYPILWNWFKFTFGPIKLHNQGK